MSKPRDCCDPRWAAEPWAPGRSRQAVSPGPGLRCSSSTACEPDSGQRICLEAWSGEVGIFAWAKGRGRGRVSWRRGRGGRDVPGVKDGAALCMPNTVCRPVRRRHGCPQPARRSVGGIKAWLARRRRAVSSSEPRLSRLSSPRVSSLRLAILETSFRALLQLCSASSSSQVPARCHSSARLLLTSVLEPAVRTSEHRPTEDCALLGHAERRRRALRGAAIQNARPCLRLRVGRNADARVQQ
ncbi:hypothetical protein DMC30DRAFT_102928 [Rhodotorula diobovata]|uniref:Uncharacterized protein n=1 Tax=Rhodotorula diobovata TaxID=5288 RepID=A0A5C5G369_9BASI|nr:hypothetical protein DMC30DRAFT_102928 [Rhodotorula diobovata]